MTVDEMIKMLQEISAQGKGNYVVAFDGGEAIIRDTYVIDNEKCVDMINR